MIILLLLSACVAAITLHPDMFTVTAFTPHHRLTALSFEYDRLIEAYDDKGDVMRSALELAQVMGQIEWLMFRHNVTTVNLNARVT